MTVGWVVFIYLFSDGNYLPLENNGNLKRLSSL
jgi:hypothetical protein